MVDEIRKELFALSESDVIKYNKRVIPNIGNTIGVRIPLLRKFAKEIVKKNYYEYLNYNGYMYFEELAIQGMIIGLLDFDVNDLKKYINFYLPKVSNWALCDIFAGGLKNIKKYRSEMFDYFVEVLHESNEYKKRFVFVSFLTYYICEKYVNKLISLVVKDDDERYYVVMSKAWLMSYIYFSFKDKVLAILEKRKMNTDLHNKTIQKIIESLKCPESEKNILKSMKIKK